ncbi:enoyl-CoA delta isomerase 1, peroxisomal [Carica papaya]|uniref:enoyl-CoA delta isomerase 1, peroxisomal n=1 Tax=Carica papaya TaxID=3649 RepID=UPI000B8CE8F6|nr:enoyl-CoA delta isomerase 1, peroxisomal [Carica papaya]
MCTLEKRGSVLILTITGSGEHRLNPTLIDAIRSALSRVREEPSSPCSALITTAQGKFFSNGFDLEWAGSSLSKRQLMSDKLFSLVTDLISLPMPTIAAVSGHASAAGLILALSHDYVLMRKDRGFLYMSEMDIRLVIPDWFVTVLRMKIGSPKVMREVIMRAAKITATEGVEMRIVDSAHGSAEETVEAAVRLGEELVGRKWDGHVYAQNRLAVSRELREASDRITSGPDETVGGSEGNIGSKL